MAKNTGKISKTAKASMVGGKKRAAPVVFDGTRVVPLNGGQHAYVHTGGRTVHAATNSEAFVAVITEVAADNPDRIRGELTGLAAKFPEHGWDDTLARLEQAGAFSVVEA